MEKKSDSDAEPVHSLWSQDTDVISTFSEDNNLSLEISPAVLPLDDSRLGPDDSDQSVRNVPSTTACSTPHTSNLVLTNKRRFESSSEDLTKKKRKLTTERLSESPVLRPAAFTNTSNGTDLTNDSDEISTTMKSVVTCVKNPVIIDAEANYSSSLSEHVSGKSSGFQAASTKTPPARNLEYSKPLKQKELKREPSKETKLKHFTEEFLCTISYTVDELSKEIVSLNVKEVSRHLCELKKLSYSSGTLADVSGSDVNSVYSGIEKFHVPAKLSINSFSSTSSSSSSLPGVANKLHHSTNKFLVPQVSDLKKHLSYRCKGSVCQSFCSLFVDCLLKPSSSPQCLTPEILSSSSENFKTDSQEFVDQQKEKTRKTPTKKNEQVKIETTSEETNFPCHSSRSSIYIPTCNNLPVFAKWPGNSWFYPGIVEKADEEMWHTNIHLEVTFCDSTVKKTHTVNLFPAYLLPSGTEVMYEKDGICETKIITSVNKLPNNELLFVAESGESIPFHKICFSSAHYKELLKENSSVLTPRKTPKFSISIENVQHCKRLRKITKNGSSSTSSEANAKVISLSTKKTPYSRTNQKRGRNTDRSSSDHPKTDKKIRGSSQKKLNTGAKQKGITTPHLADHLGKKEVVRKLCLVTPGCSYKFSKDPKIVDMLECPNSTDSESSGKYLPIIFDDIYSPMLDVELIPNISRRHLRTKSSLKKILVYQGSVDKLGPLPETELFSKYNFILTHSQKKVKPVLISSDEMSYSEEGTDFEDYYETAVPFEHLWLREQIISGGGKVYRSLLDVPQGEYSNTIVITDNIFETANYLLAVSLGIPIYRHDLIVNCCIQKKPLTELINHAMKMPCGRSLDSGQWIETCARQSLSGYSCLIALHANASTLQFWKKIILNSGGIVIHGDIEKMIAEQGSHISFIVGDPALSEEILNLASSYKIPVVSTVWVIQSIIHGKAKNFTARPEYNICYV